MWDGNIYLNYFRNNVFFKSLFILRVSITHVHTCSFKRKEHQTFTKTEQSVIIWLTSLKNRMSICVRRSHTHKLAHMLAYTHANCQNVHSGIKKQNDGIANNLHLSWGKDGGIGLPLESSSSSDSEASPSTTTPCGSACRKW